MSSASPSRAGHADEAKHRGSQPPGDARIYRYVVAYDGGTAPRPYGGWCSLAVCKPRIRAKARVGDWVIGFRGRHPGEVLYAMQVTERLTLGQYWEDRRFQDRRPGASPYPDNFYRPGLEGGLEQVPNPVHEAAAAAKDCSGLHVLLSERFWYFGQDSVPLPNHLLHLVHSTQGHAVDINRRQDDVANLRAWLASWPIGRLGEPVDRRLVAGQTEQGASPEPNWSREARASSPAKRSPSRGCGAVGGKQAKHEARPRRIILSRKGFDSSYGGMPSPILPDGRLVPLPIPASHDRYTLADLSVDELDLPALLADLSRGQHSLNTRIHLDPDLYRRPERRLPGWRPSLGQTGSAQSHLERRGVGPGDVFLFFGWFRQVERRAGRWQFERNSPHVHAIFGWLEVEQVLPIVTERERSLRAQPWVADHPHVQNPAHY